MGQLIDHRAKGGPLIAGERGSQRVNGARGAVQHIGGGVHFGGGESGGIGHSGSAVVDGSTV